MCKWYPFAFSLTACSSQYPKMSTNECLLVLQRGMMRWGDYDEGLSVHELEKLEHAKAIYFIRFSSNLQFFSPFSCVALCCCCQSNFKNLNFSSLARTCIIFLLSCHNIGILKFWEGKWEKKCSQLYKENVAGNKYENVPMIIWLFAKEINDFSVHFSNVLQSEWKFKFLHERSCSSKIKLNRKRFKI